MRRCLIKKINYEELTKYLKTLNRDDFEDQGYGYKNKNPKIKLFNSEIEIEIFKKDRSKITLDTYVNYGDFFIVDLIGGDLSVCKLTRRKYKTPKGRMVSCKLIKTLIDDCHSIYETALNGCWVIPRKFISEVNKNGE